MAQRHRRRFLRNLLITVLLALVIWCAKGCPLPTQEMELHRMERKRLAPESTVVWSYQGRQYNDRDMLVGVSSDYVHLTVGSRGRRVFPSLPSTQYEKRR